MKKFQILVAVFCSISMTVFGQALSDEQLAEKPVFTSIDEGLKTPDAVYRLNLSGQNLSEIPESISAFTDLNELILSKNNLTSLPAFICDFVYLQILVGLKYSL